MCSSTAPAPKSSSRLSGRRYFSNLRHGAVTHPPPGGYKSESHDASPTSLQLVKALFPRFLRAFRANGTREEERFLSVTLFLLWLLSASVGISRSVVLILHVGDISARFAPVYSMYRWADACSSAIIKDCCTQIYLTAKACY